MKALSGFAALALATGLLGLAAPAQAQNLLVNGDFETIPPEFPGWSLEETVTGLPGQFINSAEAVGFANNPGGTPDEFGLWLRAFAGNTEQGLTNEAINAELSQTVPATPGETYTFSGEALYEGNYSGGVPFLDSLSPSGSVPSPTTNTFEIEFLDAGGSVLSSASQDLFNEVFNGFGYVAVTPLTEVAPAGTAEVRVSANANNMVANVDPGQSAFYDNFSLTAGSSPSTDLLTNGDLNAFDPDALLGFTFIEGPEDNNTLATAGFANNTPGGGLGAWVRAFAEGDATIQADPVAATEGDEFEFSAFALFEAFYSGGDPTQPTDTLLELAFLDGSDAVISTETLDVASIVSNGGGFTEVSLTSTAPANTASVQASVVITDLVDTEGAQSAFFDDLSLTLAGDPAIPGDFDGDGDVDGADFGVFVGEFQTGDTGGPGADAPFSQADLNESGFVDGADFGIFVDSFQNFPPTPAAAPEPSAALLAVFGFVAAAASRRV